MKLTCLLVLLTTLVLNVFQVSAQQLDSLQSKKGAGFKNLFKYNSDLSTHATDSSFIFNKVEVKGTVDESNKIKDYFGSFGTNPDYANTTGIPVRDIKVSGLFRSVTIYRQMDDFYDNTNGTGMQTSGKNLSFLDYPVADVGTAGAAGTPMLQLAMTATINKNVDFRISYSLSNTFTGNPTNKFNKYLTSYGGIAFTSNLRTNAVIVNLKMGGLLSTNGSRLIFDAPRYRNNYFDRLLSNQFSVSGKENNEGVKDDGKFYLSPYIRGAITRVTFPDLRNLYIQAFIGRTSNTAAGVVNQSSPPGILDTLNLFPALNYMLRVGRPFAIRGTKANASLSYLGTKGYVDAVLGPIDNSAFVALDVDFDFKKYFKISTDFAVSKIDNPLMDNANQGRAFITNVQFKNLVKFPLSVEYYNINIDYANINNGVLNANANVKNGNAGDPQKDLSGMINIAQECGQTTNNRTGLDLATTLKLGNLTAELGYAFSQEKENISNKILIQHRVNAFSRSRFYNQRSGIGPYQRIMSIYARTLEMFKVSDSTDFSYKKGFNNIECLLKYTINVAGKKLMFFNYNNYVSVQDHFSLTPVMSDQAFIRTFYEDFTVAFQLYRRFSLIGNYGFERVLGNTRMNLSTDIDTTHNIDKATESASNRVINQTGTAFGYGFNYDITSQFQINFRHKWMKNNDKNFLQDHFKGQEFTLEFKMFI